MTDIGGLHETFAPASFSRSGGGWVWTLAADVDKDPLDIYSGEEDDVREASAELKEAIGLFPTVVGAWRAISDAGRRGHLEALRAKGRKLSQALFGGKQSKFAARMKELDYPKLTQWTNGRFEQHLIEFCVLDDEGTEYFLGERCLCIYRLRVRDDGILEKLLHPAGNGGDGSRNVGYAEDDGLESSCAEHATPTGSPVEEINVVAGLAGARGALKVLDQLSAPLTQPDIDKFRAWMVDRHNVKHFNCHLELTGRHAKRPCVRVRAGAFVGGSEMPLKQNYLTGTFMFLNTCSGIGENSFRKTLPYYFDSQGAACVTFTTAEVDDSFATEFARALYERLDRGRMTIHDALKGTREHLLKDGHPSALLYTYIGPDDFKLS